MCAQAQITVATGSAWSMKINMQGRTPDDSTWAAEGVVFSSSDAPQCPTTYLGPDLGFVNIMEFNDADNSCSISMTELQRVCSGDMFSTCMSFLQSGGEGR